MNKTKDYIEYDTEFYEDFNQFKQAHPEIAQELAEQFDPEQFSELTYYPTPDDYALYQLQDGWYAGLGLGEQNYHGAPNPLDWIDLTAFGRRLADTGDGSITYLTKDRQHIIETDCFY